MPKITWAGDKDTKITEADIEQAEDGYTQYAGDLPPGGVYRFRIKRAKFVDFSTGSQGINMLLELDGSWKDAHRKFDGCPLWDRIVMTKAAAAFARAFAAAIGVSAGDLISRVVRDEEGQITKIGSKSFEAWPSVYVSVKRGTYEGDQRLEKASTGYQIIDVDFDDDGDGAATPPPAKGSKPAKAKAGKGKSKAKDEEPPF